MAKKRKASAQPYGKAREDADEDRRSTKLGPITTYEDVADSEDEFHINRDKVLLEDGPAEKRRRKYQEEDAQLEPSDEEVLGYSSGGSDELEDEEEAVEVEDERDVALRNQRLRSDSPDSALEAYADFGGWGSSKRDYYNADQPETEADALEEEAEARRLQQKRLKAMTEADFAFDADDWRAGADDGEGAAAEGREEYGVVTEVLPSLEITDAMSESEKLKILHTRYPEFEPLAKEFLDLQPLHGELNLAASAATAVVEHEISPRKSTDGSVRSNPAPRLPLAEIKYQALSAYLGTLSMYFALLTSGSEGSHGTAVAMSAADLRDHAVMDSLVKTRELWKMVQDLRVPETHELAMATNGDLDQPDEVSHDEPHATERLTITNGKTNGEIDGKLIEPAKSKKQLALESAKAEAQLRRAERIRQTEEDLSSLSLPTKRFKKPTTSSKQATTAPPADDSDFGEETSLPLHELRSKEEARRKKKTLGFYTSQIAQKANRRGQAGKDAGGDTDLPYRERLKDRQARLNAEAEKRGKKSSGDVKRGLDHDGNDDDNDEPNHALAKTLRDGDDEDYYDLIAHRTQTRKATKKAHHDASLLAPDPITRVAEPDPVDGKRGLTYQISANKGLHPKRSKEVRNPRVKKRKQFEEKRKKLGSVRQVYKPGGEGRGGYKGELTGIKGGLVRSVKL
ncbi:MAG: hypothetical protein M1817_006829 [Caeruleum heppii]|nr:MAG: hypothetical protein M1817_006829 [Caeruleum heppii]